MNNPRNNAMDLRQAYSLVTEDLAKITAAHLCSARNDMENLKKLEDSPGFTEEAEKNCLTVMLLSQSLLTLRNIFRKKFSHGDHS